MEQEASQNRKTDVAHVELMSQGMINENYDIIEAAIRACTGDSDETAAIAMLQLKTDKMGAWAVWLPDGDSHRIGAVVVTQLGVYGLNGALAANIYSLHGDGMDMHQWVQAFASMVDQLRAGGVRYVVAQTENQRVSDIAQECGFVSRRFCVKEL